MKIDKSKLNYILLTHIHIDHAGGAGKLIPYYPQAQVICHSRGIRHLIEPEALWNDSVKSIGEVAKFYEKVIPIPKERFTPQSNLIDRKTKIIETLGHAPHHQSYLFDKSLFAGEVGGTHKELAEGFYLRPATPTIFDYDAWKLSIQNLLNVHLSNYFICYPHYGMRKNAETQLSIWVEAIKKLIHLHDQSDFYDVVLSKIEEKDKIFLKNKLLDNETRKFELKFIKNCINGIIDFLDRYFNS